MTTDIGLRYFSAKELKCPDSDVVLLAPGFGERIDALREAWGKPLKVNSCCRSLEHNGRIGGAPKSYHIYDYPGRTYKGACAVDFAFPDGKDKGDFVALAWAMGFRVEPRTTWVHVDLANVYDGKQQIMFTK